MDLREVEMGLVELVSGYPINLSDVFNPHIGAPRGLSGIAGESSTAGMALAGNATTRENDPIGFLNWQAVLSAASLSSETKASFTGPWSGFSRITNPAFSHSLLEHFLFR